MNLQTDRHPEMHSNGARDQNREPGVGGVGIHVLGTSMHGTLHTRCIVTERLCIWNTEA